MYGEFFLDAGTLACTAVFRSERKAVSSLAGTFTDFFSAVCVSVLKLLLDEPGTDSLSAFPSVFDITITFARLPCLAGVAGATRDD